MQPFFEVPLEVFFRQTANGPLLRDARGSYYRFDPDGRLDYRPVVEGISDMVQGTKPKHVSENIIDIAPSLRHRRWLADQFWKPTPWLLRVVKSDLRGHGRVGKVPILKCEQKQNPKLGKS